MKALIMTTNRIWEIDLVRGTAVFLMIVFHTIFDLAVYYNVDIDYLSGFWYYEGRFSAILFMYISGISSTFSNNSLKRGFVVLLCAFIITAVSIPIMGEYYIRFGILHFFGAVMILKGVADSFIKDRKIIIVLCVLLMPLSVILGNILASFHTDIPFLFPMGIITKEFASYDYYPVFPWAAYFIAGILTGQIVYKDKKCLKSIEWLNPYTANGNTPVLKPFCFLGRHSLIIYMVHQPVIIAGLSVLYYFI